MFLTVHTALALLIAKHSPSVLWAFIFGLISHYFLDLVPHGDKELNQWLQNKELRKVFIITLIDVILAANLIAFAIFWNDFNVPLDFAWAAVIGAILPDFLNGLNILFHPRFLEIPNQVHYFFHCLLFKKIKPFSLRYGLIVQLVTLVIIFYFL